MGGAAYVSGRGSTIALPGSLALAAFAHEWLRNTRTSPSLYTDPAPSSIWIVGASSASRMRADQVARGQGLHFQSHMWMVHPCRSRENLDIAEELLDKSQKAHTVLEIEIGAVGGEEDGPPAEINEKLYSTPEDGLKSPADWV